MILFTLFSLSKSIFWEYDENEIDSILAKSFDKPLMLMCWSHFCGHCRHMPNETARFKKMVGNRDDVIITVINCANTSGCNKMAIRYTPYIGLAIGHNSAYWPESKEKEPEKWIEFLNESLKPRISEVSQINTLESIKQSHNHGGTVFYLEIPSRDHILLEKYTTLSKKFYVFRASFSYKIVPNVIPSLVAYRYPYCEIKCNDINNIEYFIEMHKYGNGHGFTYAEVMDAKSRMDTAIIVVEDELHPGHNVLLKHLASNHCGTITPGWISSRRAIQIMRTYNLTEIELPAMVFLNKMRNCNSLYTGRVSIAHKTSFLDDSIKGKLCDQKYISNNAISVPMRKKAEIEAEVTKNSIHGWVFSLLYLIILMIPLFFFQNKNPIVSKIE